MILKYFLVGGSVLSTLAFLAYICVKNAVIAKAFLIILLIVLVIALALLIGVMIVEMFGL